MNSEKQWAVGSYIPIINSVLCLLEAVRMVNSRFCLFHARQGLVLFGTVMFTIFVGIFSKTLSLMMWGIVLVLHISGFLIAWKMKDTRIPVIGQIADMIPETYIFRLLTGKIYSEEMKNTENQIPSENQNNS